MQYVCMHCEMSIASIFVLIAVSLRHGDVDVCT